MGEDYYKKCKICDKEFTQAVDFNRHIKSHSVKVGEYILKHELDDINPTCKCGCGEPTNFDAVSGELERGFFRNFVNGHNQRMVVPKEKVLSEMKRNYEPYECKVCGTMLRSPRAYKSHVQKEHGIDMKDYVIKYLWNGTEPKCECGCGKTTNFEFAENLRHNNYYNKLVGGHHWNLQEFRVKVPQTIEKIKKTNLEKYGVDNVFKSDLIKTKAKKTKLEKYGDENFTNIDKQVQTKKVLYGITTKEEHEDIKLDKLVRKYELVREKCLEKLSKTKVKEERKRLPLRNGNEEHICSICGEIHTIHGLGTHLKFKHPSYTINKYVKEFGEFRRRENLRIVKLDKESFKCLICQDDFVSDRELSYHLRLVHNFDKMDYVKDYIHKDNKPLCKCGCGNEVSMLEQFPYRRDYYGYHNSGIRKPFVMTENVRKAISRGFIKRMESKKPTKPELLFQKFLDENSIEYVLQKSIGVGFVDFHLVNENINVEIDGEYYHPDRKECMTFTQMVNATADLKKDSYIDIRLRANDVKNIVTLDDLLLYTVEYQKTIPHDQILISSWYLRKFHQSDTTEYLLTRVSTVEKFVKAYFKVEFSDEMRNNVINCFKNCKDITFDEIKGAN